MEKENILTATDYVNLRKENELLMNYNQDLIKKLKKQKEIIDKLKRTLIDSKEYKLVTSMGLNSEQSILTKLLEILEDKEV